MRRWKTALRVTVLRDQRSLQGGSPITNLPVKSGGLNARSWESLQSRCAEAAGRVGQRILLPHHYHACAGVEIVMCNLIS